MSRSTSPVFAKLLRFATIVLAFALPPFVAGFATLYARTRSTAALQPVATADLQPVRPPAADGRRLAVIVAGNRGTEITDSLPLVELLEESGAFEVRIVAPERIVSPFRSSAVGNAGLDFVPDMSFADYDTLVGRAPDLLLVPYLSAWQHDDAAVVPWIRAHVGPQTTLLSICQGAEVAAATGLFDGYTATGNERGLDELAAQYPQIHYKHGVRWVRDGKRMSSGSLAAGLDATLAAIDSIAGHAAALRAAAATSYRHTTFLDDPTSTLSRDQTGSIIEMAFRWHRPKIAVVIGEGAPETAIAALLDMYAATLTSNGVAVAMSPSVLHTRHGIRLLANDTTAHLGAYDHIAFATMMPAGVSGYDAALAEVARTHGNAMARSVARGLNYPARNLGLDGGMPVGATMMFPIALLGLLGLLARHALLRLFSAGRIRAARTAPARDASLPYIVSTGTRARPRLAQQAVSVACAPLSR
jgi:transcriptional regulator GlxA family with amidase domain